MSTPPLVKAFYDRIWNSGDLSAIDALIAEDFSFHGSLGVELSGRYAFKEYVRTLRSSLSEYHCAILQCVAEEIYAFAKMQFSGIHRGPFRGFTPTGQHVSWLGAALFRFSKDAIADLWVLGDLQNLDAMLRAQKENNT